MAQGRLITFEGLDGAGKSTQAQLLADRLRVAGHDTLLTREPGGAPGAEEIRRLLVEGDASRWSAETEILLFTAARRDHVERTILPALARGAVVISDRFVDSTRAYQGERDLRDKVDCLHRLMIGIEAHLTLIFDLPPETGLARTGDRTGAEDRFEKRGAEFQADLRARFRAIAAAEPERCALIDAERDAGDVAEEVAEVVARRTGLI